MKNWLTSDLHLNHQNIIRYCDRPFRSVEEMNRVLIANWNNIVAPNDTVFFLGDLAFDRNPLGWLEVLNGHIVFIRGSHDSFGLSHLLLNGSVMLIHNPAMVNGWKGWVIHGHVHNNAPFIDREAKRVNVSVEVTGYKPVNLTKLLEEIKC